MKQFLQTLLARVALFLDYNFNHQMWRYNGIWIENFVDKIWITCCNVWLKCTGKHGMMDWKTSWCMSTFFGPTCLCVELQLDGGTWFSYFIFDALQCYLISSKTRKVMDIVYSRLSFKIWMEQEVGKVGGWRLEVGREDMQFFLWLFFHKFGIF